MVTDQFVILVFNSEFCSTTISSFSIAIFKYCYGLEKKLLCMCYDGYSFGKRERVKIFIF